MINSQSDILAFAPRQDISLADNLSAIGRNTDITETGFQEVYNRYLNSNQEYSEFERGPSEIATPHDEAKFDRAINDQNPPNEELAHDASQTDVDSSVSRQSNNNTEHEKSDNTEDGTEHNLQNNTSSANQNLSRSSDAKKHIKKVRPSLSKVTDVPGETANVKDGENHKKLSVSPQEKNSQDGNINTATEIKTEESTDHGTTQDVRGKEGINYNNANVAAAADIKVNDALEHVGTGQHKNSNTRGSKNTSIQSADKLGIEELTATSKAGESSGNALDRAVNLTDHSNTSNGEEKSSNHHEFPRFAIIDKRGADLENPNTLGNRELTQSSNNFSDKLKEFIDGEGKDTILRHARFVIKNEHDSEIRLLLRPQELGVLRVRFQLQQNVLDGKFIVDSQYTKDIIEKSLADIQRHLREQGIESRELEVTINNQNKQFFGSPEESAREFGSRQYYVPGPEEQVITNRWSVAENYQTTLINLFA